MKYKLVSLKAVLNRVLFELENPEIKECLDADLFTFLNSHNYPWELIGENLKNFLIKKIHSRQGEKILSPVPKLCHLVNKEEIIIEEAVHIEAGAYICGPAYISKGSTVRHGAYIRGEVFVSENSVIGHATECKNSLFLPNSHAAHFNYVGNSILGFETNLGAGTKLANLKFNKGPIKFLFEEKKIDTQLKKLGAILGNRSQTGCNTVTNPGTILLNDAFVLGNQNASGIVSKINA